MMPGMNGLEVMIALKADEHLKWLPVVMQTSAASPREMCEGIESGAFFYLTKPYDQQTLIRIVSSAVEEGLKWQNIAHDLRLQAKTMGCLQQARFHIQTMDEAYDLALLVARACPDPERVAFGLNEIIMNGVEHGNLLISFDEKTQLQEADQWEEEIVRRQALSEHANKFVEVVFERFLDKIQLTVTDQGPGFDWCEYENIQADRLLDSHGRGIAMAKALSFDHLEYQGNGNHVVCWINVNDSVAAQHVLSGDLLETE
jgi:hypothetical protein